MDMRLIPQVTAEGMDGVDQSNLHPRIEVGYYFLHSLSAQSGAVLSGDDCNGPIKLDTTRKGRIAKKWSPEWRNEEPFSAEFKTKVVLELIQGKKSLSEASREYEIKRYRVIALETGISRMRRRDLRTAERSAG